MKIRIPKKLITIIILSGLMNLSLSGYADDRLLKNAGEGLSVSVSTSDSEWSMNEPKLFEVQLTNVSNEPFLVDVFGDLNEVYEGKRRDTYVLSCWSLIAEGIRDLEGPKRGRYTLTPEQFIRLAPGESYTKRLQLETSSIPIGEHEVRLAYVPRSASTLFSLPNGWEKQQGFTDPIWIGMAFSEQISIHLVDSIQ